MCLLVLIVIVIAGGKLNFSASKSGVGASIGKESVDAVTSHIKEGAQEGAETAAKEITDADLMAPAADAGLPESIR
jgi:hypothetical protein